MTRRRGTPSGQWCPAWSDNVLIRRVRLLEWFCVMVNWAQPKFEIYFLRLILARSLIFRIISILFIIIDLIFNPLQRSKIVTISFLALWSYQLMTWNTLGFRAQFALPKTQALTRVCINMCWCDRMIQYRACSIMLWTWSKRRICQHQK